MFSLFTPMKLGNMTIKNRFVHSATFEGMARESGEVTDELIKRYRNLAKGDVGLIIPGYLYVHQLGRAFKHQTGIHSDDMIPGLKRLVDVVHLEGGKIAFQLVHAGRQTTKDVIGRVPKGPSNMRRDPITFTKAEQMSEGEIHQVIRAFGEAAYRAVEAGADAIQIHAAHGYLVNQFISPFFNQRKDGWGGSDENRFRFLREVVFEIKKVLPEGMPILVKLNTRDYTPREGITLSLAVTYARWLAELGIDGLEISCGTMSYSFMNVVRGDVPVDELVMSLPAWKKPVGKLMMQNLAKKHSFQEGYNLEAAKMIKPVIGEIPLIVVGGMRRVAHMEDAVKNNYADFISMCRPFIREPSLVKKIREGKAESATCISCNRCLASLANDLPLVCYVNGYPKRK